jgi:predicted ATPase
MAQIRQGLTANRAAGTLNQLLHYLALLAESYGSMAQVTEGLAALDEALTLTDHIQARWYEAELYRLKGELMLHAECGVQRAELTPEACFQKALDIARHQQAKSWELRATTSLARLWQSQDKRQEAHDLLALIYGWFTEGFDTADLQEAKSLLDELA